MQNQKTVSKYFLTVVVTYITCLLLSNLIAGKMWAVTDNITLPAAVILFPITYICADVFTEVYGFHRAKRVIWLGFACSFFAVCIYMLTIALPHPQYWTHQEAFSQVLGTTPRVALASFAGYLFGEFSNSILLSRLKVLTKGKYLWLRTVLSTVVGEGFDSVIFITISFWGVMPLEVITGMIVFQYLFKVIYEILLTPLTYKVVKWLKNKEEIDTFDCEIKYNILKG